MEKEIKLKKFWITQDYPTKGDLFIHPTKGDLFIQRISDDADGEGGWFDADKFEDMVEKFYNKYF